MPPPESARRPDWDVNIRQHPPLYEPREPSDSTDWDSQPDRTLRTTQVDDVYVRTVVERHTSDQLETSRRRTTEFRRRPAPPPPDWDVEIRQHPPVYERRPPSDSTDWDAESQPPAEPPVDWNVRIRQHPPVYERRPPSDSNWDADSQPPEEPPIDWDVRIRQVAPQPPYNLFDIDIVIDDDAIFIIFILRYLIVLLNFYRATSCSQS